jgi:hypothetical protein
VDHSVDNADWLMGPAGGFQEGEDWEEPRQAVQTKAADRMSAIARQGGSGEGG